MSRLGRLIDELKRRRVFRVAIVYAAVAFMVWQAAEVAFPALGLPNWTLTFVVVAALLGFPIALVLAWAFEITPQGVMRTEPLDGYGRALWAERYDRELTAANIFEVQSDVALQVAAALRAVLSPAERERIESRPTENLEAYDLYQRGNDYERRSEELQDHRTAVQLWERSAELDPSFALPYAKLVRQPCYMHFGPGDRSREHLSRAGTAAARLRQLAPDLSETHLALGWYYYHCLVDYDRALEEFTRVLATQANNPDAYAGIAGVRRRQGHWDQTVQNWEKASELDPLYFAWMAELPPLVSGRPLGRGVR